MSHTRSFAHIPSELRRWPLQDRSPVRKVGHRVDEYEPRLPPPARNAQRVRVHGDCEPRAGCPRVAVVLVFGLAHRLEPARQGQGVAVVAAGRDPVTAGRGVPGGGGPLDRAAVSHAGSPPRSCSARVQSYAQALTASWPPAARPAPARPGQPAVRTPPRGLDAPPPAGGIRGSGPRRRRRRPRVCGSARYTGRTTAAVERHAGAAWVARAGPAGRRAPRPGCGSLRCSRRRARPGRPEPTRPPGRQRRPGQAGGLAPGEQPPRAHAGQPVEELPSLRLAVRGGRIAGARPDRARGGGSLVVHWWIG